MQFAHKPLQKTQGQSFYKLMGSGKDLGFNPWPDWSVYSLLQVWENEAAADQFFQTSPIFKKYENQASTIWTLYMRNSKAHGAWSGANPFTVSTSLDKNILPVAIITRASIKVSKLAKFWSYVPTSEKPLKSNKELLYTKGIGEAPIIQMATFSLWSSMEAMKAFAYGSKEHQEAIHKTRKLNWYKEELFARFQPYKSIGQWDNLDLNSILK